MYKINKKIFILVLTAILLITALAPMSAMAIQYVRPYIYNVKARPYRGATIGSSPTANDSSILNGLLLTWDHVGSLAWTEIVMTTTPITDANGNPVDFSGTQYDPNNPEHVAIFTDVSDNYYKLDRSSISYNDACQTSAFITTSSRFYDKYGQSFYIYDAAPGKTYYIYILLSGQDIANGTTYWFIGDCFEYTTANTMGVTPNGLTNTIKYALVQNDDTNYYLEAEGIIHRWNSYADYQASNLSRCWYVKYSSTNGYTAYEYDFVNHVVGSLVSSSKSYESYGTFVDTDIEAAPGTTNDYIYQIYQSNTAAQHRLPGVSTSSVVPGPIVATQLQANASGVATGLTFDIYAVGWDGSWASNATVDSYLRHYRWTVLHVYAAYLNTCKNKHMPTQQSDGSWDPSTIVYHNGVGECGDINHPNPFVVRGGRFGNPSTGLPDATGTIVTNTDGALLATGEAFTTVYGTDRNPTDVTFSFSGDWNEAPLYLSKGTFPNDPSQVEMMLTSACDLTRGQTYIFAFTSCYEYAIGETPPGWTSPISQANVDNHTNKIYGVTYVTYTVPYMNAVSTGTNPDYRYEYKTFGNTPNVTNTPIDVTVTWTDFEYKFDSAWDPSLHKYHYYFNPVEADGGRITITNNGLADITAKIDCPSTANYIDTNGIPLVECFFYDRSVPSDQRDWLNLRYKPNGVDIAPSGTLPLQLYVHNWDNDTDIYHPSGGINYYNRSIVENNPLISNITLTINEKYKFITS